MLKKNNKNYRNITQITLTVVSVIFFVLFYFCNTAKAADYYCNSCSDCQDAINNNAVSGDTIYLTQDIINIDLSYLASNDRACFLFDNKQNITINCQDYVIDGIGSNYGMYFRNNSNNNTAKNCYITGFSTGIHLYNSGSVILNNISADYNTSYGIYSYNSNSNILTDVTANNNHVGLYFPYSSSNTLSNITANNNSYVGIYFIGTATGNNLNNITANNNNYGLLLYSSHSSILTNIVNNNNQRGIWIFYSNSNNLSNITSVYNSGYGFYFYGADNNQIFNNVIKWNATNEIYIYDTGSDNNIFYNNELTIGSKIYDNGTNTAWDNGLDGNHWDSYDQESENCYDESPLDGYCDSAYQIDVNSIDNHAKHISLITDHYCNSCADCNDKIASSTSGDTVYLSSNIINTVGNCIDLSGLQNLTFDCQGFTVDSDGNGGNGFYLENAGGDGLHTIQNCFVSDFDIGIYVLNSNQNIVIGNTIKQNANDITISNSISDTFYNNEFLNENKIFDEAANNTDWDNGLGVGNHWEDFDSDNEGCVDAGGYCAGGYTITSSEAVDNYAKYVSYDPFSCNSCADCNIKIATANSGDTITLANNIMNYAGTCIEFDNKSEVTFDCNDYVIDGIGGSYYGVYMHGSGADENNTIKNCYITQFMYGVYINNSSANNLDSVTANYNKYSSTGFGIYVVNSNSNILTGVVANSNDDYGMYFTNSNSNILTNITANNNMRGAYFNSANSNTLTNITANYNSDYGIYFSYAIDNDLVNITMNYNVGGIYFTNSGNNTTRDSAGIKFNRVNININSDGGAGNKFYNNELISINKITDNSALTQWDDGAGIGNWWQSYDTSDEGCTDGDSNLICDSPYVINETLGTRDNFPEWKKINNNEWHCADCASCSNAIADALYGDTVILDNHILGASNNCIDFNGYKEGITFDGHDYFIQGVGNGYGIYFHGYNEDNTIKNFSVSGFSRGVYFSYSYFNFLMNIAADYNDFGIYFYGSCNSNYLTNITSNNNYYGTYFHSSDNNILTYVDLANNNYYGIYFYTSDNNTVASSTVKSNGINISTSNYAYTNVFYNNEFTSKEKISDSGIGTLWDNGADTGNWWEAYDTDDESCYDGGLDPDPDSVTPVSNPVAGDNLCDNHYEIKTGVFDEYPEYQGVSGAVWTCSDCSSCNERIAQASYGDTVQLDQNIFGVVSTCINFNYKQGITFDCQNHIMSGVSGNNGYGVYLSGNLQNDYNTVKNCNITKFSYGVFMYRSHKNTLDNIISYSNKIPGYSMGYGFFISSSNSNIFTDLTAYANMTAGIYFANSNNNELAGINVNNNGTGIYFYGSDNNIVANSTDISSNQVSVYINSWSDNNIFYDNQFVSKEKINDNNLYTRWNNWDGSNIAPGNHWESYDTAAEGCVDANADGYCDSAPYWKDNFPKYYGIVTDRVCDSCESCNSEIVDALYGETITLTNDIADVAGPCINFIYKEGVTFDCDNKKITGTGSGSASNKGIYLDRYNINNNVKNCGILNFSYGVYAYQYNINNAFENITVNNNDCTDSYCTGSGFYFGYNSNSNNLINIIANNNELGIYIDSSSNNLTDITAEYNGTGIRIAGYSGNKLTNVNLSHNTKGLELNYSDNTIASSSTIKLNTTDINIRYSSAENNLFYNNEFMSKDKVIDKGTNTKWDNGALDGGNNWEMFNQDADCYDDGGTEVCCTGGLFCANAYKIDDGTATGDGGVSIDNFPIRDPATPQEHLCETCEDCSTKISQAIVGDIVKLTKDIIGHSGTCIDFGSSVGIIFDGQDYLINGDTTGNGIYLHGSVSSNNIVKNCNISSFYNGVYISGSNSNNLIDITVNNNYFGIRSESSQYTVFNKINASNNYYGFYISRVTLNNFTDITANYNNNNGIHLTLSSNNTLTNITANNNIGTGIYFDGNSSSFFNNIIAINNNYGIYLMGGWYNKSYFGATVNNNTIVDSIIKWNATKDIDINNPNSSYYDNTVQDNIFYNNQLIASSTIYDNGYLTHWNKWDSAGGNQEPGNHWEAFDSDSEGCFDADSNGYCDSKYEDIPIKNYDDNYPKYFSSITTLYCNSCADCNEKIASSTNGSTIYLANNISDVDVNGHCLDFSDDKQNLIFDCQDYTLTGDTTGNGIYLNNTASAGNGSNSIKNCVIENFNIGINIADSDNNTIANSAIKQNTTDAQLDNVSDNNIFYSNEFFNENKMADSGANTNWDNGAIGNHWEEYDEPAESCDDNVPVSGDGYCDVGYTLISSSGAIDNYAEYVGTQDQFECNNCADCNAKIIGANSGDIIKLTANILNQSGNCIEFNTKSGVTFDCQGYAVDGNNASYGSKGVYFVNSDTDNKIKNCQITGFHYGVYFRNSDNNYLQDLQVNNNKYDGYSDYGYGIYFTSSNSNNLTNITANNNYNYGIYFGGSNSNNLTNITVEHNNTYGIYFSNSDNNTASSSEIKWNKINVMIGSGSDTNTFYNNKFISKEKIQDNGAGTLWDNGLDTGNWWESFDWEQECYSGNCCTDNGGACGNPYEVETGIFDNFPKYAGPGFNDQNKICDSCANCTDVIQNAYYGEQVKLSNDIITGGTCIDFGKYKEGITFNGQDYYIYGDNWYGSSNKGVYIHGSGIENNSVKNCTILGFDYGIYAYYSSAVRLDAVALNYNNSYGIYFSVSNNNILTDVIVNYNNSYGISLNSSSGNILTNITANNNSKGIYIYSAGQNILSAGSNNIIKNNSQYGIYIACAGSGSPVNNIIASSTVKQNKINIEIQSNCTLANKVTNIFYNNEFISKEGLEDNGEASQVQWDNGADTGNWWEAFDTDAEGCVNDGAGICIADYEVKSGIDDHYPKYKGEDFNKQDKICDSCATCSTEIQNAYYGEKISLTQNISASGDCIDFGQATEGATFNGQDKIITGNASGKGIYIHGYGFGNDNNRVENCKLLDFSSGIYIDSSASNTITNIIANNPGVYGYGVYLNNSNYNNLKNINVDYNYRGVYFTGSNYNNLDNISAQYSYTVSSCSSWAWGYGLYFYSYSNNNTVTNSAIKYHYKNIYIYNSTSQNNKFYNNHFISKEKMEDNGIGTIWDNGSDTGNWWEACGDVGGGNCLEDPYVIKTGAQDNYPKYDGGEGIVTTCISCSDCNEKIFNAKYGETARLTQDIFNHSGTCIEFKYKQGITFDGGGCASGNCIISGIGGGNGVYVCGDKAENNTIKNVGIITRFATGLYIDGSDENIIIDVIANNNENYGINLYSSDLNRLETIIANNNNDDYGGAGVYLSNSNNNILNDITSNYNYNKGYSGGGIYINNSDRNTFENITANYNTTYNTWGWGAGIYFNYADDNILNSITARYNNISSNQAGGGISFYNSHRNILTYATSTDNYKNGIYFNYADDNTVSSSIIKDNSDYDVNISNSGSNRNIFYTNEFNAKGNVSDQAGDTHWNRWDGANQTPGNSWLAYNTPSEGCYDNVEPYGYCDDSYEIKTGVYDYYPIMYSVMPSDFSISNAYIGSLSEEYSTCKNILLWENNGDASRYIVYRSENGGLYSDLKTISSDINYYIDSDVAYTNDYSYKVEAINGIYGKYADCDSAIHSYCANPLGAETTPLYPTICNVDLIASSTGCGLVGLGWDDETPTDNYYAFRSLDQGISYQDACCGDGDPPFNDICTTTLDVIDADATPYPNDTEYYYQDTEATSSIDYYYKARNCVGICPSASECQPDAIGPRNDCYVESNIEILNPCLTFPMPTWKEVGF